MRERQIEKTIEKIEMRKQKKISSDVHKGNKK